MYRRRRVLAFLILLVAVGLIASGSVAAVRAFTSDSSPERAGSSTSPSPTVASARDRSVTAAGSLGDPATEDACTLLTRAQIGDAFGRKVSGPFATYPFCQWFIGRDAFVAAGVRPRTSITDVRDATTVVDEAPGVAADAFFGSDRHLYFGDADTTYWVMYQRVGEFTGIREAELEGLAGQMLAAAGSLKRAVVPSIAPAAPPSPAPPMPSVNVQDPLRIWFGGDSLAAGPTWAFFELTSDDHELAVTPEYQVGTGLVRDDYFDWIRHGAGVMAGLNPDVAIFMSGANDNQALVVNGTTHAVGEPAWTKEFRRRVGVMMDVLTETGRPVIWAGMPPMQNPTLDHGMQAVNAAYEAEAAERPLVTYIDTYALFGGEGGIHYTDRKRFHGTVQTVRLSDGIHLNGVGSTVQADAILRALRGLMAG